MGRARLRMELLPKKARRKAYETRKKGLEKKAKEFSTLCGVDMCMIMYPPPLKNEEVEPFVWSNNPDQVANLIESHKLSRLGGECSRSRTCDLAWFYKDQTRKVEEEIDKLRKKNREVKYPNWDERYDSLSLEEMKNLTGILTEKIDAAKGRSHLLKEIKIRVTEYSNTSTNPMTQENSGFSMLGMVDRRFEQYNPLPYFVECYNLEYHRRMLAAAMTMNMGASCNISVNPVFNHSENGVNSVNPMSYNLETVSDHEPQKIGQCLMINNSADYFPQMDAAYGQRLMVDNPTDYNFPQMDASYGENSFKLWNF